MTPKTLFIQSMIAVNVALPLGMLFGLGQVSSYWPRMVLFLLCVVVIFTLNQRVGQRLPEFKKWVWGMQALNLICTVLFGAVGVVSALGGIWVLLQMAIS